MRKSPLLLSLLVTALLLTACGTPAAPTQSQPTSVPPTSMPPATDIPPATDMPAATEAVPVTGSGAMVAVASSADFGPILVDEKGMTLYMFEKDTPNTSSCYGGCATNWPPLLTTGAPLAGEGLDASLLGTTTRDDGNVQVTYNGWPLYYYVKDAAAGDMTGQGVGDVWFVLSADGSVLKAPPEMAPTTPTVGAYEPY